MSDRYLYPKTDTEASLLRDPVDLRPATAELVMGLLKDPRNIRFVQTWEDRSGNPDQYHPFGKMSTVTTPDNPAVIVDDKASFCSPVITFDEYGNALHFHDALVNIGDWSSARTYQENLTNYLTDNGVVCCIAGLNVCISELYQRLDVPNPIDNTIFRVRDGVSKVFPAMRFIVAVAPQYPNQTQMSRLISEGDQSRGFVFIPRYLAKDDRNHLLIVLASEDGDISGSLGLR